MPAIALLTFDIEFSIGGAFADRKLKPVGLDFVTCPVRAKNGEVTLHGLPWVLDCLTQHDVKATFFVEALHRQAFADDPMAAVAQELHRRGHEVQLHLHPAWLVFDDPNWASQALPKTWPDSIHDLSQAEFEALIRRGQASFAAWGIPPATALRTGSLEYSPAVYRAAKACGLTACSNMGQALWQHPDQAMTAMHRHDGIHLIEGVLEYPVSCFEDFALGHKKHHKIATIQGSSAAELLHLGERLHHERQTHLLILSHAFEYVIGFDAQMQGAKPHGRNQEKLHALLRHSKQRHWQWKTLSQLPTQADPTVHSPIKSNRRHSLMRMLANRAYEYRMA
ncbi:MAG: hypothetical protein RLZZ502_1716 [Pseudomonadota bacterium]